MLKSLKRAVVPGLFSRSRFKVSDETKEYLIKRHRPVIFSHHQLKRGLELGIVFKQLIKMAKLHIMVVNSMLLEPQWHRLDSRKRCWIPNVVCAVVEHNIHKTPSRNINGKFCWMTFLSLIKNAASSKNSFLLLDLVCSFLSNDFLINLAPRASL